MAYDPSMDDEEAPYQGDHSGQLHPALAIFRGQAPYRNGDGTEQWAEDATDLVQNYVTGKAIADRAREAGEQFITDVNQTQQNLVGMVRGDPASTDLALRLADHSAAAIAGHHPDEGERDDAAYALAGQFKNQIAHTAVQRLAGINENAARDALDRYDEHLTDADRSELGDYITNMGVLRSADDAAHRVQLARSLMAGSDQTALAHLSALADPETGALAFPPNWGTNMMSDGRMAPQAKGALYNAFTALRLGGDPPSSDPRVISDILDRAALPPQHGDHPDPLQVISQVGRGLTIADAQFLAGRLGPQSPAGRDETIRLAGALGEARDQIGNREAFGRFTNWFLPAYQRARALGATDVLDPGAPGYMLSPERMAAFQPTGDDVIAPVLPRRTTTRPSLAEIFGKR